MERLLGNLLWRLLLLAALLPAGCTPRPGPEALVPVTAADEAQVVRVYVATTRAPEPPPAIGFSSRPSLTTSYAYYDISVPPEPREGPVYWSRGNPDPRRDFLVTGYGAVPEKDFAARVGRDTRGPVEDEVTVFVHGYNQLFAEALLRLAKLTAEAGADAPVLFSWPSKGRPLDYLADMQEAEASRDALAGVLSMLAPLRGQTLLMAHSMGGWLSMEALRSLRLAGRDRVVCDQNVMLVAPDIDVLVFHRQLEVIGRLPQPIAVMVAGDDRALALSSRISTQRPRLGALDVENPIVAEAARSSQVQLIDISSLPPENAFRHDRFQRLAAFYGELETGVPGPFDAVRTAGAFVLDSLGTGLIQAGAAVAAN